jgi:hypothetical protein
VVRSTRAAPKSTIATANPKIRTSGSQLANKVAKPVLPLSARTRSAEYTLRPKGWLLRANFPEREHAAEQLRGCKGAVLYEEARDGVLRPSSR